MIEVEIKCKPTPEEKAALLKYATLISEEQLTDIYYDSKSYELSLKDFWLRTRNNKFVLKIPATKPNELLAKQSNTPKHEIEDEDKIRELLNLTNQEPLIQALACAGYTPLYTLTKTRNKYTKSGFIIDVDHATFENFTFDLVEIETMVQTPEEINQAMQALITFAQKHGITINAIPGNLIALIEKVNPEHSALLEKAYTKRIKDCA
jgi:adenylate cyclase class IV